MFATEQVVAFSAFAIRFEKELRRLEAGFVEYGIPILIFWSSRSCIIFFYG